MRYETFRHRALVVALGVALGLTWLAIAAGVV
jgi:hypothetical protein